MTPCVFECTCFLHDLSHGLDKLSPRSIKYIFVGYFRTQKGYGAIIPPQKYLVSADVTFFESVPYFATHVPVIITETVPPSMFVLLPTLVDTDSLPMPPAETTDPPTSKPVQNFRYIYTHRPKVPASEPVPTNPSPVDGPPPPSASPSDLDIPITLRKGKRSCTDHLISNFVSYDHLNPFSIVCSFFVF